MENSFSTDSLAVSKCLALLKLLCIDQLVHREKRVKLSEIFKKKLHFILIN